MRRKDQHTKESSDRSFLTDLSFAKTISQNTNLIGRVTKNKKRAACTALVSFSAFFLDVTQPSLGGALHDIQKKTAGKETSTVRTLGHFFQYLRVRDTSSCLYVIRHHLIEVNREHFCIFQGFFSFFPESLHFRPAPMYSQFTLQ